jgi:mRNA interferase MazF
MKSRVLRGEIYWAVLPQLPNSSVIHGKRPVMIVSNDRCNSSSPVVTIVPLTSKKKKDIPTHVEIYGFGLSKASVVLTEQLLSIDKSSLGEYIGTVDDPFVMKRIDECIELQLAG